MPKPSRTLQHPTSPQWFRAYDPRTGEMAFSRPLGNWVPELDARVPAGQEYPGRTVVQLCDKTDRETLQAIAAISPGAIRDLDRLFTGTVEADLAGSVPAGTTDS